MISSPTLLECVYRASDPGKSPKDLSKAKEVSVMAKEKDGFRVLETRHIDPTHIKLTDKFRGRSRPVEEDEVVALADSMGRDGQRQPIQARMNGEIVECIFGNTRTRAGMLLKSGYRTVDGNNKPKDIPPDPNFKLRVEIVDATDEQAFRANVVENALRNQCTAMDTALNQEELRTTHGMTDAAIARLYGWSGSAGVNRLKKLLKLPPDIQQKVHMGTISASSGTFLADCEDVVAANAFDEIFKLASQNGETANLPGVKGQEASYTQIDIVEAIKKWRKAESEKKTAASAPANAPAEGTTATANAPGEGAATAAAPTPTKVPKTLKQVRDFLSGVTDDKRTPPKTGQVLVYVQSFIKDEMTDVQVVEGIMSLFGEHPLPTPETAEAPAAPAEAPAAPAEAPAAPAEAPAAPAEAPAAPAEAPAAPVTVTAATPVPPPASTGRRRR